jgi:ribosomal protein S18 acetylase RimI-like enzyme
MSIRIVAADVADGDVAELLFAAVGGDRSRLAAVVWRYRDDPAAVLIAAAVDDRLTGVAGYEVHPDRIVLLHIAVRELFRRRGIGARLLAEVGARGPDQCVVAETDREALGFYLAVGFTAVSLGEKYPGVERFEVRRLPR